MARTRGVYVSDHTQAVMDETGDSLPDLIERGKTEAKREKKARLVDANLIGEPGPVVDRAQRYIDAVVGIEVVSNRLIRLAMDRHKRQFEQDEWAYYPAPVEAVIEFLETLPHTKGSAATRREKLVLSDWQVFIVSEIYGWRSVANPVIRKHREVLVEVGRKNGKTTFVAGIALYELMFGEDGGEIYSAATKADQARIVWTAAQHMAERMIMYGEWTEADLLVRQSSLSIRQSIFKPVSKQSKSLDGLNPSMVIIDEAAAIEDRNAISVMDTALQSRESPLMIYITTAQSNRDTAYWEKRMYVEGLLNQQFEDHRVMGLLYGLDEGDDYRDSHVWVKANPNLGVSVIEESLLSKVRQSDVAVHQQADIRLKHFNEWVDGDDVWIDAETWGRCKSQISEEMKQKGTLYVGIDLSQTEDLSAVTCVWQVAEQFYVESMCWTTEAYYGGLSDIHKPVWRRAIDEGVLRLCEGRLISYEEIEARLDYLRRTYHLRFVGVDPYNATNFVDQLERKGIRVLMVSQTIAKLNAVTKRTRELVIQQRLHHDGNEFLGWQVSNAMGYTDVNENVKVKKNESTPQRKIDAVIGMLNAMAGVEASGEVETAKEFRFVKL